MQTVILLIDWVLSRTVAEMLWGMISIYSYWFMHSLFISVSKLFQLRSTYRILVLLKVALFWNTPLNAVLDNRVMFLRCAVSLLFLSWSSYHCILHKSLYVFGHFSWWDESVIHLFFTGGQWWLHYLASCTSQWKAKYMSVTEEKMKKVVIPYHSTKVCKQAQWCKLQSLMYHLDHSVYQGRL
jgi:hypothetical protein